MKNQKLKQKQLEYIKSGYSRAKQLAKEIWLDGDHEGTANDYYYFECGFVVGLNYQRLKALEKLSELDQEMGLE
jgi:hypothetical protein